MNNNNNNNRRRRARNMVLTPAALDYVLSYLRSSDNIPLVNNNTVYMVPVQTQTIQNAINNWTHVTTIGHTLVYLNNNVWLHYLHNRNPMLGRNQRMTIDDVIEVLDDPDNEELVQDMMNVQQQQPQQP